MLRKQLGGEDEDAEEDEAPATASVYGNYWSTWKRASNFDEFVDVFTDLVCAAQECIRELCGGERSSASLRDVRRCTEVFRWFAKHFFANKGPAEKWTLADFFAMKPAARPTVRKAAILSIAFCYHARLPRNERQVLVGAVCGAWRKLQVQTYSYGGYGGFGAGAGRSGSGGLGGGGGGGGYYGGGSRTGTYAWQAASSCEWLRLDEQGFNGVLSETQRQFTAEFNVGEGIAKNEALCENLFMILISVLNQIPIFVIGKPGSSKSLAMGLVQQNLNGSVNECARL